MAVGLAGQMHGAVLLDGADEPLRPAILWNDQRTAAECDEIRELVGADRLIEVTGNDALPGSPHRNFSGFGGTSPRRGVGSRTSCSRRTTCVSV